MFNIKFPSRSQASNDRASILAQSAIIVFLIFKFAADFSIDWRLNRLIGNTRKDFINNVVMETNFESPKKAFLLLKENTEHPFQNMGWRL
ncbi:hypothetical protein [Legionella wadsworthii]|uniref:hypothetical protein n=1 Tax=Legionella wadsworthii TaxID=28088 RepID=UPI0004E11E5C|nr:hypothetical protein [Legionella wadsworthii]